MKEGDSKTDESLLIGALKKGDQNAFRLLVDNNQNSIIRVCRGFLKSDADSDDVAQEVFIEAYRSINKFRGDAGISTWLYRIAVNKSLNWLRYKKGKSMKSFEDFDKTENSRLISARSDLEPDREIARKEHAKALDTALNSIPASQRTAFILNKYEELSYKSIAEIMKISVSSVESLLFRAKTNLQSRLYEYHKKNIL